LALTVFEEVRVVALGQTGSASSLFLASAARGVRPGAGALPAAGTRARGFSLIEVIVAMLVLSILGAFAFSSYSSYVKRARAADAVEQLDLFRTRMEKGFQDNGNYGVGACTIGLPVVDKFGYACALGLNGQTYSATATGAAIMSGYVYSIDERGFHRTAAFPGAASVPADCWMVQKDKCQ
jgi:type IV pilus assembly protein PilE